MVLEKDLEQLRESEKTETQEEFIKKNRGEQAFAYWKNDFYLSTPDENFWMKIRGNLHFDTKFYSGNSENSSTFDIRRARMDFQGMWYKYIEFRVQAEFADSPYIRNAWVDYMFRDWLHLRAGQMKPPFSTAWLTTDNNLNFLERGASTPIYPYFDKGWLIWGDLLNRTLTWNLSVFTGAGTELDEKEGDIDDHKDYVARLFYSPFKNQEGSFLEGLHMGLQGTLGQQSVPTKRFEQKGYSAAIRDSKFWTWETESPGMGKIDSRNRWGGELHYINGPFSLSSEYLATRYKEIDVFADDGMHVIHDDGAIVSWSTWVGYFLTGEQKSVNNFGWKQPKPFATFDPGHSQGSGAWEVLFRYTNTKTSESFFNTYNYSGDDYRILEGASNVNEYSMGLSWIWNPMVSWQLNYVHLNGNGMVDGSSKNEDMIGLRMIFKF
ncbi:MAG: porin [Planctomycetota bacterium]